MKITARVVLAVTANVENTSRSADELLAVVLENAWPGFVTWTNADTGERFQVELQLVESENTGEGE